MTLQITANPKRQSAFGITANTRRSASVGGRINWESLFNLPAAIDFLADNDAGNNEYPHTDAGGNWQYSTVSPFSRTVLDDTTANNWLTTITATRSESGAVAVPVLTVLRRQINIKDFGAVGDGSTDDTTAFTNAVAALGSIGGTILIPSGTYKLTSTVTVAQNGIKFRGEGKTSTIIKRDFASGPTFDFVKSGNAALSDCGLSHLGFDRNTATSLGTSNVAHVKLTAGLRCVFEDILGSNVVEGFELVGGALITLSRVSLIGDYAATDKARFGTKLRNLSSPGSGATALPSYVNFHECWFSGPQVAGFAYPLWITAGEHIYATGGSYFGQGKFFSVLIEQGSDDALILDVVFDPSTYIDGADKATAGDGVYITGSGILSGESWDAGARTGGSGAGYIGNTRLLGTIKGQAGDGRDGVRVDGTARGGTYAQAVRGLKIAGCVCAWDRHGLNIGGGVDVDVSNATVQGNNYNNASSGSGVVLGATTVNARVLGNRIGGDAFGGSATAYQVYPVDIVSGATGYEVGNNVILNNTNDIRDGAAAGVIFNNRLSTDDSRAFITKLFNVAKMSGAVPQFQTERSDAHGDNIDIGHYDFYGRDDAGNRQLYAGVSAFVRDDGAGSEDAALLFGTIVAGTFATRAILDNGLHMGTPTGGDKGLGTINVSSGYYVNNAAVYYSGGTDVAVADGGTGGSDAATARTNLAAAGTGVANTFTAGQAIAGTTSGFVGLTVSTTDPGASGPNLDLYHNSASPAVSDTLAAHRFIGKDSGGNVTVYGFLNCVTTNVTDTTEGATFGIGTLVAGATATRLVVGAGVMAGAGITDPGNGFFSALNAIRAHTNTAIPAGGTAGAGFTLSSTSNFGVFFGSGAPTLSAAKGSLYLRSDGSSTSTRLYVNTDGATAWTNVTTAA